MAIRYAVVDAFTDSPFKGNPAAVCLLEKEAAEADEEWMQSLAAEFNISATCFLNPVHRLGDDRRSKAGGTLNNRFNLRWFTPVAEVDLCGHGALAAAHFLLISGVIDCDTIEFITKSGLLTAKRGPRLNHFGASDVLKTTVEANFSIELDFPVVPVRECAAAEIPSIPKTLHGVSVVNVQKIDTMERFIVELASGKELVDLKPNFDELHKCSGRGGIIVTAPAISGSGFDFFSRFFCPKFGINEDPVCGSAHCSLAPYWSKKLGKKNLIAYMASRRGGRLDLQLEEETQRVYIKGEAVIVMEGTLLV